MGEPVRLPRPAPEYPAESTREFLFEDTDAGTSTAYGDGSGDCHPMHEKY